MRWLSESADVLEEKTKDLDTTHCDVVVIGSGYGGSVAALRLAQQGLNVFILERGLEYVSGDFPNTIGTAISQFRTENGQAGTTSGYATGLFDVRFGKGIAALVGNALGGTSQINANVALKPDPRVFNRQKSDGTFVWPQAIRSEISLSTSAFQTAYTVASRTLEAENYVGLLRGGTAGGFTHFSTKKTEAIERLGKALSRCAVQMPITVNLKQLNKTSIDTTSRSCIGCGDCVSGCNNDAKRTLTTTYLPQAISAGASAFTGVTVLSVLEKDEIYSVSWLQTESKAAWRTSQQAIVKTIKAKSVVIAAGTFGSTEILQRSKLEGLTVSDTLGSRLSTNGDGIYAAFETDQCVNSIGDGADSNPLMAGVGPTITRTIEINDAVIENEFLIQDASIPGALKSVFHELITTAATASQLDQSKYRGAIQSGNKSDRLIDWSVLREKTLTNSQVLLTMGHDSSPGDIRLTSKFAVLKIEYRPTEADVEITAKQAKLLSAVNSVAINGLLIENPLKSPIPASLSGVLSGPKEPGTSVTVHPLGGCPIGADCDSGVVNDLGQVFRINTQIKTDTYKHLLVLDGSIIPGSLGANPFLTITALAERSMAQLAIAWAKNFYPDRLPKPSFIRHPLPNKSPHNYRNIERKERSIGVNFSEVLRGGVSYLDSEYDARLFLQFKASSLQDFFDSPNHTLSLKSGKDEFEFEDKEGIPPLFSLESIGNNVSLIQFEVLGGTASILPATMPTFFEKWGSRTRSVLTWFIDRGAQEIYQKLTGVPSAQSTSLSLKYLKSLWRLVKHVSEERKMLYRVEVEERTLNADGYKRRLTLIGEKNVRYPAAWTSIFGWVVNSLSRLSWLRLERVNIWKSLGRLDVKIIDVNQKIVGGGVVELDLIDMTRMHAPQLSCEKDSITALIGFSGYPIWFFRYLLKTRVWDFRLPEYPEFRPSPFWPLINGKLKPTPIPTVEVPTPWPRFPSLRIRKNSVGTAVAPQEIPPEMAVEILAPPIKGVGLDDQSTQKVIGKLTRYRQKTLIIAPTHDGYIQCKVLLMMHGFAQPSLSFTPLMWIDPVTGEVTDELKRSSEVDLDEPSLAEFFYEQGFDIWLFDYRTSPILDASKEASTMDQIGEQDIPFAIDHILSTIRLEIGPQGPKEALGLKIFAYTHCVAAGAMAMSLLSGKLHYDKKKAGSCKLAGVTLGQLQTFVVGSPNAQMRLGASGVIKDLLGINYIRLSAAEKTPSLAESLTDRFFASLPVDDGQYCPAEHSRFKPQTGICTCKRMAGTISRLLDHARIKKVTHDLLAVHFGRANTALLAHGGKCVDRERLVSADGQETYVTEENIRNFYQLPIAIKHGKNNALFDVESATRTFREISRVNPRFAEERAYRTIIAESFTHFDCTIGYGGLKDGNRKFHDQILTPLKDFYNDAWAFNERQPEAVPIQYELRSFCKAPLIGPIVGWTRKEGSMWVARVWIEIDNAGGPPAQWVIVQVHDASSITNTSKTTLWQIRFEKIDNTTSARRAIGLCDIEIPAVVAQDIAQSNFSAAEITILSLHLVAKQITPSSVPAHQTIFPAPLSNDELASLESDSGTQFSYDQATIQTMLENNYSLLSLNQQILLRAAQTHNLTPNQPIKPLHSIGKTFVDGSDIFDNLHWPLIERLQSKQKRALSPKPNTYSRTLRQAQRRSEMFRYPGAISLSRAAIIESGSLCFAAASCKYPGLLFEDRRADEALDILRQRIFALKDNGPQFMLHAGDQVYVDATAGLMDSPSALDKVTLAYERALKSDGFWELARTIPNYMLIDDHEIQDNWSADAILPATMPTNLLESARARRLKSTADNAFNLNQFIHGPQNLSATVKFCASFEVNSFQFFNLDSRTQRSRFASPLPTILSAAQWTALNAWFSVVSRTDKPKFLNSGSVIAPGLKDYANANGLSSRMADNWQLSQADRTRLFQTIVDYDVKNLVLISGDYHLYAHAEIVMPGAKNRVLAIVTPPLYAPIPGANVSTSNVMEHEIFTIKQGNVTINAWAQNCNSGFVIVRCIPIINTSGWQLSVELDFRNHANAQTERTATNFTWQLT